MNARRDGWHIPGLTGIRALAALWVLVHHLNAVVGWRPLFADFAGIRLELTPLATCGWVGVDIFFVLSGFLLTRQLLGDYAKEPLPLVNRRYYLHRILRVYPAYLAQMAVLALVTWTLAGAPGWLAWVPLHLAMLQGVSPAGNAAINPVYWTLTVEFWFYGLLPFAVAYLHGGGPRKELSRAAALFAATVVVSIAWRGLMFALHRASPVELLSWSFGQLPGTLELFGAGLFAACACRALESHHAATLRGLSGALVAGGLAALLGLIYALHWNIATYWTGSALLFVWQSLAALAVAAAVAGTALDGRLSRALFATAPVVFVGKISYSLYLWHFPVALAVARVFPPAGREAAYLALALLAVLAASALSHRLVEQPALALRGRWERRFEAREGTTPA